MAAMPRTPDPQTSLTPDWEDEKAKQEEIASQIDSTPQVAGTSADEDTTVDEAVAEQPKVTLRSVNVDTYPLTVSVVGAGPDGLVFEAEGDTLDVDPQVAAQVAYMPSVEVVA